MAPFAVRIVSRRPHAAARVAVDSREAALEEAGELVAAIRGGVLAPDGFTQIGEIAREWAADRDPAAITIFKSVGLAIQDVAAAELVMANLPPDRESVPG